MKGNHLCFAVEPRNSDKWPDDSCSVEGVFITVYDDDYHPGRTMEVPQIVQQAYDFFRPGGTFNAGQAIAALGQDNARVLNALIHLLNSGDYILGNPVEDSRFGYCFQFES